MSVTTQCTACGDFLKPWHVETHICRVAPLANPPGPTHYRQGSIEPIEFILANPHLGFCEGAVIKYLYRWRAKDGIKDLEKALAFVQFLIDHARKEAQ